ncbi:40S ribosomal protein S3a-like [Carya illinoinensis]|uniref:40S ribosomal protein S3a-like n=1 Tax=Carya illinoinensis TaxID=32201 RepID=UPI001C72009B|nr:40S ribosomal protein S3a-like [Carya illinoinensis]
MDTESDPIRKHAFVLVGKMKYEQQCFMQKMKNGLIFVYNSSLLEKQIASEGIKHRVIEVSMADLQDDEDHAYREIRLRAEDVQGKNVIFPFLGNGFYQRQVEVFGKEMADNDRGSCGCEATDSYSLRMFCIGFTKRRQNQVKRTCYAQSSQSRQVKDSLTYWLK